MNILAINGSPHRRGHGARIIQAILKPAADAGLKTELVHLYDKRISGCAACNHCKRAKQISCAVKDDMPALYRKIVAADAVIVSSPVYMGQVAGPFKTFLDRWYAFLDAKFQVRNLPGKKLVVVVTSGAPAGTYSDVARYLKRWMGDFLKMAPAAVIQAGGLKPGSYLDPKVLAKAEKVGRWLAGLPSKRRALDEA
jgi:multimeric flavodoxin WrbA